MKSLIILVSFLFLVSPALASESGVEVFLPDGVEIVVDSEYRAGPVTVVLVGFSDGYAETTVLFASGFWMKGWGAMADPFVVIGSASLADNINITIVLNDADQFLGAKLQR